MEVIRAKIGFESVFMVDNVGRSGGLALLWSTKVTVDIQNYSRRHINIVVHFELNGQPWKFTGFYGNLEPDRRKESWDLLCHLRSFIPMAWMCIGDFNEILEQTEKFGSCRKSWR
jgi:hypothetical protein